MIIDYLGMVQTFMRKHQQYEFIGYEVPNWVVELRIKLIDEEVNKELIPALNALKDVNNLSQEAWLERMVDLSDAVADSLYVIFGTCHSMGVPVNEVYAEIQRSNMTKSGEANEYGKIQKGPNFEPPRIREIFEKLLRGGQDNSNESTS